MHLKFPVDFRGALVWIDCEYLELASNSYGENDPRSHCLNTVRANGAPVTLDSFETGVILRAAQDEMALESDIELQIEGM